MAFLFPDSFFPFYSVWFLWNYHSTHTKCCLKSTQWQSTCCRLELVRFRVWEFFYAPCKRLCAAVKVLNVLNWCFDCCHIHWSWKFTVQTNVEVTSKQQTWLWLKSWLVHVASCQFLNESTTTTALRRFKYKSPTIACITCLFVLTFKW